MSGSNSNNLSNPAVPNNTEVPTLLIEKFNGRVHEEYGKKDNILGDFYVDEVVGTNMVSNKAIGDTTLQVLSAGTKPEATPVEYNKNAFIVDTVVLGRNATFQLHDVQNDFDNKNKIAKNQIVKMNELEDQMALQQLAAGAFTGGVFNPTANTITGGVSRVSGQGVAIKVDLIDTFAQAQDPYMLVSAIEIALMGLIIQKVPIGSITIYVPINEFSLLQDYGFIAIAQGGSNEIQAGGMTNLMGTLKSYGVRIKGSVQYSLMKMNPHDGADHSLLSNADNGNRYDVTADMQATHAIIAGSDGLLAGRSINLSTDIYFDKDSKSYFIDSWNSQGCIYDRYDNLAIVGSNAVAENTEVSKKAKGKSTATKTYA